VTRRPVGHKSINTTSPLCVNELPVASPRLSMRPRLRMARHFIALVGLVRSAPFRARPISLAKRKTDQDRFGCAVRALRRYQPSPTGNETGYRRTIREALPPRGVEQRFPRSQRCPTPPLMVSSGLPINERRQAKDATGQVSAINRDLGGFAASTIGGYHGVTIHGLSFRHGEAILRSTAPAGGRELRDANE